MSRITQIKTDMQALVAPFTLREALYAWPATCDPLIASVRKYYLLVPVAGLQTGWSALLKARRRQVVRAHLDLVCDPGAIRSEHVATVDEWLSNMDASRERERVIGFGRLLEERYGQNCFVCGRRITEDRSVDHILPVSRGGHDSLDNYMLCHRRCNAAKSNNLLGEGLTWVPRNLADGLDDLPPRLRYLVHLRDDFTCQHPGCGRGILSGDEITVAKQHESGIACYDNLAVRCAHPVH